MSSFSPEGRFAFPTANQQQQEEGEGDSSTAKVPLHHQQQQQQPQEEENHHRLAMKHFAHSNNMFLETVQAQPSRFQNSLGNVSGKATSTARSSNSNNNNLWVVKQQAPLDNGTKITSASTAVSSFITPQTQIPSDRAGLRSRARSRAKQPELAEQEEVVPLMTRMMGTAAAPSSPPVLDTFTSPSPPLATLSRLYGRDEPVAQLRSLFGNLQQPQEPPDAPLPQQHHHLVWMQGPPGVGLSSVVQTAFSTVVPRAPGFWGTGRCVPQSRSRQRLRQQDQFGPWMGAGREMLQDLWHHKYASSWSIPYTFTQEEFVQRFEEYVNADQRALLQSVWPQLSELLRKDEEPNEPEGKDLQDGENDDLDSLDPDHGFALLDDKEDEGPLSDLEETQDGPELDTILEEDEEEDLHKARQDFQDALLQFFRLLASFGPVCLVLDQIQLANATTMEMVRVLLNSNSNREGEKGHCGILIVALERRQDQDAEQEKNLTPAYKTLRKLRKQLKASRGYPEESDVATTSQADEDTGDSLEEEETNSSASSSFVPHDATTTALFDITDIQLENLRATDICDMLAELLLCKKKRVKDLARVVCAKTHGNPLYMKQFLESLQQQSFLRYDFGTMTWAFDVEQIKLQAPCTDNVLVRLQQKLPNLPLQIQEILPLVACLGTPFLDSMFHVIAHDNMVAAEINPDDILGLFQEEGLIVACGRGWYQWEHDKLQEAAFHGFRPKQDDPQDVITIQFNVGNLLLRRLKGSDLKRSLFVITNLLNCGIELLPEMGDDDLRMQMIKLNLRAGMSAFDKSAYENAVSYLNVGLDLLPAGMSAYPHYQELRVALLCTAAETEFCRGNFAALKVYCDEVFSLPAADFTLMERRRAFNATLDSYAAQGRQKEGIELILDVLSQLGCKLPKRGRAMHSMVGIVRNLASLKTSSKQLASLPKSLDAQQNWVFYLLDRLIFFAYQCDADLMALAIMKAHRLTLQHGTCEYSSPILSSIGVMLAGALGDFDSARVYADYALKIMTRSVESRTLFLSNYLVLHWQMPFESCRKSLIKSYDVGLQTGDVESAFWSIVTYLEMTFYQGGNLQSLQDDCRVYAKQADHFSQHRIRGIIKIIWQMVANMGSENSQKQVLSGDIMNEKELMAHIDSTNDEHTRMHLNRFRMTLAFWFNDYQRVVDIMESSGTHKFVYEKLAPGLCGTGPLYYYCALSCVHVARETQESKYKKYAIAFHKKIKAWVKKGNSNLMHAEALLDAELDVLENRDFVAPKKLEIAFLLAERRGLKADQAYIHERCATLKELSDAEHTEHHEKALSLYTELGALGKLQLLPSLEKDSGFNEPAVLAAEGPLAERVIIRRDTDGHRVEGTIVVDRMDDSSLGAISALT
mmetsp:Transcript_13461/g.27879  ORF Transcript_13461/g.27879 Transcript_13461/m.27879 type:complete len:1378 (-) Transcript_13461:206-4339(-)|eukprot:CAMPEP_0172448034 /NCGR_PEP_ID=MMETSP1065-20121228/7129_1 /TAXON_ID=265537 /ORGANISM="Amphiprora paludosa, Strain CCMP125" /LENGTH=1377 /DNA_ID=CAMNT_0013199415 /DNA_START=181 /DNA_END=4314 /DNA_ORIENTATION=+